MTCYAEERFLTLVEEEETAVPFPVDSKVTCEKYIGFHGRHIPELDGMIGIVTEVRGDNQETRQIDQVIYRDGRKRNSGITALASCLILLKDAPVHTNCKHPEVRPVYLGIGPAAELINVCTCCKEEV